MLYLLGGASRAGKSKLARRLLLERQIPSFSLDVLMMGLANGYPAYGLNPNDDNLARGEALWPLVRAMAVNLLETRVTYLLEGDVLLPKQVAELCLIHGKEVRTCFLGYRQITPATKLQAIRQFGGDPNDWLSAGTNEQILALVAEQQIFSAYLEQECGQYQLPYVDTSAHFRQALEVAFSILTAS